MATLILITTIITTISSLFLSPSEAGKLSFTVDYIHRDSPLSPYYNSSQTPYERLRASARRGVASADRFRLSSESNDLDIMSRIYPDQVEYLMSISIGTPPFKILAIADTGSDLIWTQCKPCQGCYRQNSPIFDPSGSSTFEEVSCGAGACPGSDFQCDYNHKCSYSYHYNDGSFTDGVAATDTVTFDSSSGEKVSIENINIGCTHKTGGTFRPNDGGLIGLSGGPLSLISQLGDRIGNKFSYCLVPFSDAKSSSTFTFGSSTKSTPPESNVVKVPFIQSQSIFYSLNLESFKVANTTVPMVNGNNNGPRDGNIFIDSGTTVTLLPSSVVDGLISAISKVVTLPTAVDPQCVFKLCYNVDEAGPEDSSSSDLPDIKLDFGNDAVVTLPPLNTFFKISESITCLSIISMEHSSNIIGNIAQQNFLIEYDVGNKELSFAPMDCTKS